jgi:hypothetical protein
MDRESRAESGDRQVLPGTRWLIDGRPVKVAVGILSFCQFVPSLMSTVPFEVSEASTNPCQWRSRYWAGHA